MAETQFEENTHGEEQITPEAQTPELNTSVDNLTPEPMDIQTDHTENLSPCDMEISSPV